MRQGSRVTACVDSYDWEITGVNRAHTNAHIFLRVPFPFHLRQFCTFFPSYIFRPVLVHILVLWCMRCPALLMRIYDQNVDLS